MSAVDRAQEDIVRGELWLARRRLSSYLVSKGYDPEVLRLLGDVCHQMHDDYEAGRMWLASTADGELVETAIQVFLRYNGNDPKQVAAALPTHVRLTAGKAYPPVVQKRLRILRIEIALRTRSEPAIAAKGGWLWGLLAIVLLIIFAAVFFAGLKQTFRWLFG